MAQSKILPIYPARRFHLLQFPDNASSRQKVNWINKYYNTLSFDISIPNHKSINYNNLYALRSNPQIIKELQEGYYGDMKFISKDKYKDGVANIDRKYIAKGFPLDMNETDFINYFKDGKRHVKKVQRMKYNEKKTTSVQFLWTKLEINPPKKIILFEECNDSPTIDIEEWVSHVRCFHCQLTGHISKDCKGNPVCPISGREHTMKDCKGDQDDIFCCHCKKRGVNAFNCDCKKKEIKQTGEKVRVDNADTVNESMQNEIYDLKAMISKLNDEITNLKKFFNDKIDGLLDAVTYKNRKDEEGGGEAGEDFIASTDKGTSKKLQKDEDGRRQQGEVSNDHTDEMYNLSVDVYNIEKDIDNTNNLDNEIRFRFDNIKAHVEKNSMKQCASVLAQNNEKKSVVVKEKVKGKKEIKGKVRNVENEPKEGVNRQRVIESEEACKIDNANIPSPMTKQAGFRKQRNCKSTTIFANSPYYINYV